MKRTFSSYAAPKSLFHVNERPPVLPKISSVSLGEPLEPKSLTKAFADSNFKATGWGSEDSVWAEAQKQDMATRPKTLRSMI